MIIKKVDFLGIPVSVYSENDLQSFIQYTIEESFKNIIYGFSFHSIYSISRVPEIIDLGKSADMVLIDGRPFYWLLKLFKIPVKSNTSIPEAVMIALDIANKNKYSILLFGSTEDLNSKACYNIKLKYPNIRVLEGISGYFDFQNDFEAIMDKINTLKPDILLIGISSPKKETIAFGYKESINSNIIIPCGGMIDVLAGKTKLTPPFLKSIGLASLYRAIQEPRRLLLDRISLYLFVFFDFLPVLFWQYYVLKKKDFSIVEYYR